MFKTSAVIEGIERNLQRRRCCLSCVPLISRPFRGNGHEGKKTTCPTCGNPKENVLRAYCKTCQSSISKAHYVANRSEYSMRRYAHQKVYRDRNMRLIMRYLASHPCVDCSEADPVVLDFDHVNGEKSDHVTRLAQTGRGVARVTAEIRKCVVRCANCHRRKTARERGWIYKGGGAPLSLRARRSTDEQPGPNGNDCRFDSGRRTRVDSRTWC